MSERTESSKEEDEYAEGKDIPAEEREVLVRLGVALLDMWDRLPRDWQQDLFAAAAEEQGELDLLSLRRKLALVLHAHHERTSRPAAGAEGHPPAGPHAKPELTNFDATPGSGVLPPRKIRQKDVDPGAG